ncbi:MAG: cell surface protein, partial [Verrucomicrobia bacterium]
RSAGAIEGRNWDFGDGSPHSSTQNPSHTFNNAGDYTITLTVIGAGGATSSKSVTIHVTATPPPAIVTADFTANPTAGQAPLTVRFVDRSTGPITAWDWDFGDGSPHSAVQSPTHVYTATGDFTVTLKVTCTRGTTNTKSLTIHVEASAGP